MNDGAPSPGDGLRLAHVDDNLRLMAKVARMYHERGMTQSAIADQLHVSQAKVSRLLKNAVAIGMVRTTVTLPPDVHTDLEDQLIEEFGHYGLEDAIVVDASDMEPTRALGAATAQYLETTLKVGDDIGISSWSATLLAAAEDMRPSRVAPAHRVVQVVGGLGDPKVQMQATRLLGLFASGTAAEPISMPTPGMLSSAEARRSLMSDPMVKTVMKMWADLSIILVGIGSVEGSELLRQSGNALVDKDLRALTRAGAVGDVCLRFFNARGEPVKSSVNDRVVGIDHAAIRRIPRRVGVAGGAHKHAAIKGALQGGWINVLITDLAEAQRLLGAP